MRVKIYGAGSIGNHLANASRKLNWEVDIYDINHWHTLHGVYVDNLRRSRIEQTATKPVDAINSALDNFWEQKDGSYGSTEQEELLQLSGNGD